MRTIANSVRSFIGNKIGRRRVNLIKSAIAYPRLLRLDSQRVAMDQVILVTGDARSGTSWLGELVTELTDSRQIFEPLLYETTEFRQLGSGVIYADEDVSAPGLEKIYDRIFRGQLRPNYSVDRGNDIRSYSSCVVKALRMNYSLRYIRERFPDITVLFIIRHPLAVLRSQCEIASDDQLEVSRTYYQTLLENEGLQRSIWSMYGPYTPDSADYRLYKLAGWCCLHRALLDYLEAGGELDLVSYEHLFLNPSGMMSVLQDRLDKRGFQTYSLSKRRVRQPSRTTQSAEIKQVRCGAGHDKWRSYFSESEQREFAAVLAHFDLEDLFDDEGLPATRLERHLLSASP